jgi:hypothetical protein
MPTLSQIAVEATQRAIFSAEDNAPFQAHLTPGVDNVVLVTGSNASGKSVFFRVLAMLAKDQAKATGITLSIRERTGSGTYEMAAFRRSMMYGEEHEQSTGACSVHTVDKGFSNARRYAEEGTPVVLMLDEPEMGLSDDYAAAMGQWLAEKAQAMTHQKELGLVVVTHSRPLVKRLVQALGQAPTFVNTDGPQTVEQWLKAKPVRTVEELLALDTVGMERRRAMDDFVNNRKRKPAPAPEGEADSKPRKAKPRRG